MFPDDEDEKRDVLRDSSGAVVASVVEGENERWYWTARDENGDGGENDYEEGRHRSHRARWCADRAARVAFYESAEDVSLRNLGVLAVKVERAQRAHEAYAQDVTAERERRSDEIGGDLPAKDFFAAFDPGHTPSAGRNEDRRARFT